MITRTSFGLKTITLRINYYSKICTAWFLFWDVRTHKIKTIVLIRNIASAFFILFAFYIKIALWKFDNHTLTIKYWFVPFLNIYLRTKNSFCVIISTYTIILAPLKIQGICKVCYEILLCLMGHIFLCHKTTLVSLILFGESKITYFTNSLIYDMSYT